MNYTKCANCRKWDECARCGACHTCHPDVRDACIAVRAVREAQSLQSGRATRKRQSTPYAPGMGQNGTKPRASDPRDNWYRNVRIWEKEHEAVKPTEIALNRDDQRVRPLTGEDRRRAIHTTW